MKLMNIISKWLKIIKSTSLGYLGRELQDMEKVVVYTTGRYLTETMSKVGFNAEKTIKGLKSDY